MARQRKSTGGVITRETGAGTSYAIRFRAYGKRRQYTLGTDAEGMTRETAERELEYVLEQVRRGEWMPPEDVPTPEVAECPTFAAYADEWMQRVRVECAERTIENYEWAVEGHLKPYFGSMRLDSISTRTIDAYRIDRIREREATGEGLSNNSINKTLFRLRQIFDEAIEDGLVESSPAAGKRRLAKADPPKRTWLDTPDKIEALLNATDKLNRKVPEGKDRALVATLVFGGLRIGEALDLRWSDVDLASARLSVRGTKTEASDRTVNMVPALLAELKDYAQLHRPHDGSTSIARVFGTNGAKGRENPSNVRTRVLKRAVEIANSDLASRDLAAIGHVTPHTLRRTFASLLVAIGESPIYTMGQLGHTDPKFTMRVYSQLMSDRGIDRDRIAALVDGSYRALTGTNSDTAPVAQLQAA